MTLRDKIAKIITDNYSPIMENPHANESAEEILSLLSKEGKELPLVDFPCLPQARCKHIGEFRTCADCWRKAQRDADQPYVNAANARAEKAEAELKNIKGIMESGCQDGENHCIYLDDNKSLQAQLDKANEEIKTLKNILPDSLVQCPKATTCEDRDLCMGGHGYPHKYSSDCQINEDGDCPPCEALVSPSNKDKE